MPFAIAIAWLAVRHRWLAVPAGIIACAASYITAWLFSWPMQSVIATTIPCLIILGLGYRQVLTTPGRPFIAHCARYVAVVGTVWLILALAFDAMLPLLHLGEFELYDAPSFWMDVRFYLGWAVGLALAPAPYRQAE